MAIDPCNAIGILVDIILPEESVGRRLFRDVVSCTCGQGAGTHKEQLERFLHHLIFGHQFFIDHGADHFVNDFSACRGEVPEIVDNSIFQIG